MNLFRWVRNVLEYAMKKTRKSTSQIPQFKRDGIQIDGILEDRQGAPAQVAIVYQSELDYISQCILDYPHIETGGQLFGFWTTDGIPVVLFAIGPGENANHEVAFFNQDVDYLVRVGQILITRYGLQHIGEWHSHHQLGLARPSGHDASTMVNCIRRQNSRQFLLCIGNCTDTASELNAYNFTQSAGHDYVRAAWDIKEGESPFRALIESDPDLFRILTNPKTKHPSHGNVFSVTNAVSFVAPSYAAGYWLNEKANNLVLKHIVDKLATEALPGTKCAVQMDQNKCVHILFSTVEGEMEIVFLNGFPGIPPIVLQGGRMCESEFAHWQTTDNLFLDFCRYYHQLTKGGLDGSTAL